MASWSSVARALHHKHININLTDDSVEHHNDAHINALLDTHGTYIRWLNSEHVAHA